MFDRKRIEAENGGKLPACAWPGGYPIFYIASDGGILCAGTECANGPEAREASCDPEDSSGWRIEDSHVHWEGPPLTCAHCGAEIESAYGDPDAD